MKLGIIVPYRKRPTHLRLFQEKIQDYLKDVEFELIIVEQVDTLPFNRGKLLNIGFTKALRLQCDYVVFHDVDMIPTDVDYSYSPTPLHLATNLTDRREIFDTYFGGVTLFPIDIFKRINGYGNEYWGWGFEDDDLLLRLGQTNIFTNYKEENIPLENTSGVRLHGEQSYIRCSEKIEDKSFTFHLVFKPDEIPIEHEDIFGEYFAFCIPGTDMAISWNSFNRYRFQFYDIRNKAYEIVSDYSYERYIKLTIVYDADERVIEMYIDGDFVGKQKIVSKIRVPKHREFFLGTLSDSNLSEKSFCGYISEFGYWDKPLLKNEIKDLSNTIGVSLISNYEQYSSANDLKIYYDFKHTIYDHQYDYSVGRVHNLVSPRKTADVYNCIPTAQVNVKKKTIPIPDRRDCKFKVLIHESEGYTDGGWKTKSTRLNQIRYYSQLQKLESTNDGLSNLKYKKISDTTSGNVTHISVEL